MSWSSSCFLLWWIPVRFFSLSHMTDLDSGVLPLDEHQLMWWKMPTSSCQQRLFSSSLNCPLNGVFYLFVYGSSKPPLQWFYHGKGLFLTASSGLFLNVVLKLAAVNTVAFSSYPQPCQAFCSRAGFCGDGCPSEGSGARHGLCALFQFISMWMHHCRRVSLKQRAPCSSGPRARGASIHATKTLHDARTVTFRVWLSCAFKFGLFSDESVTMQCPEEGFYCSEVALSYLVSLPRYTYLKYQLRLTLEFWEMIDFTLRWQTFHSFWVQFEFYSWKSKGNVRLLVCFFACSFVYNVNFFWEIIEFI